MMTHGLIGEMNRRGCFRRVPVPDHRTQGQDHGLALAERAHWHGHELYHRQTPSSRNGGTDRGGPGRRGRRAVGAVDEWRLDFNALDC